MLDDEPILVDGALPPERAAALQAYVDELAQITDVTEIESVLSPPAGLDEATYLALAATPEDQRPPEAAGVGIYLDQWIADDVVRRRRVQLGAARTRAPAVKSSPTSGRCPRRTGSPRPSPPGSRRARPTSWPASPNRCPYAIAVVVGVTMIVLFLSFGSVLLPIKAVLDEPPQHHRQLRRAGLDLPGGQHVGAARTSRPRGRSSPPPRSSCSRCSSA